jgi:hypothetical protein
VERYAVPTTVSLTFAGGYHGQAQAATVLAHHGLAGTFYVNSGYIGFPDYMSVAGLRTIERNRSEIGGAGVTNRDLTTMSDAEVTAAVCDDRATLAALGFVTTSFSFPHGHASYAAEAAVKGCGYNSARSIAGLYRSPQACAACPLTESLPPTNPYSIRTTAPGATVKELKQRVAAAELTDGGWVVLALGRVCTCPEDDDAISPRALSSFATWLAGRPATTRVRTVDQVVRGRLQGVTGTPLARLFPPPPTAVTAADRTTISRLPAWTVLGVGIGQAQLLSTGLVSAVVLAAGYRVLTRGRRYGR